jgi:hypothetical protein
MSAGIDTLPSGVVVVPVGSRVTCDPPPTDTDEDYLVLTKDKEATIAALMSIGFEYSSSPEQIEKYQQMNETSQWSFTSLWFGDMNYIITDSQFFFERFLTATHVCKKLNLLRKEDRIMVFEAVRGGSFYKEVVDDWAPSYEGWVVNGTSGAMANDALAYDLLSNVREATDKQTLTLHGSASHPTPF